MDAAMVGVPADIGEQDIQLYIQPRAGVDPEPAAIWTWMADRLAPHQRPRFIVLMADFPRTPSQRIQKHLLPKEPEGRWEAPSSRKVTLKLGS
jgi:crotonobetaine/carnitine-CoA ligase